MKTILSFLAILIATYASAAVIYVSETASGANNGTSWANAYNDLQDGLANSNAGDEIWVAAGVYYPGTTRSSSFVLLDDVKLYGGFNGTETLLSDRGNYYDFPTTLSGDIGVLDDQSDNCYHVVRTSNALGEFYMDGFYIQYGAATSGSLNGIGGGISFQTCESATVRNCFIANNEANEGGGVHIRSSADNVSIEACVLGSNFAELGAAVYSEEAYYMESCLIAFNSCSKNGIIFDKLAAQIVNCTIAANTNIDTSEENTVFATDEPNVTLVMTNSIIYDNVFNSQDPIGTYDNREIVRCIFSGETAEADESIFNDTSIGAGYEARPENEAFQNGLDVEFRNSRDVVGNPRVNFGSVDIGASEYEGELEGIVFVDQNATGNNDGSNWLDAYTDLAFAMRESADDSEFWIAEGTYYTTSDQDRGETMPIKSGFSLYGGFAGDEYEKEQRNFALNKTIVSGDIGVSDDFTDNSYRLMVGESVNNVVIDGLCFRDIFRENDANFDRGAIWISGNANLIANCEFTQNRAYANACVQVDSGEMQIENSLFHHNFTLAGGIVSGISNTELTIIGCTFADNNVTGGNSIIGSLTTSNLTLLNSIVWSDNDVNRVVPENGNAVAHNCILFSGSDDIDTFSNIRSEYPEFIDPENNDYQITAASNAYDSGDNSFSTLSTDLLGNPRISDTSIDRGCYESLVCEQPNDLCANAIALEVDGPARFGSNRCATNTSGEESTCFVNDGHSVWYSFVAPTSGSVEVISSFVSKFTGTFNMRHVIFSGDCNNLTQLACDNESGPSVGETTPLSGLTPEDTYFIRFDGFNIQEGRFTIRVESVPIPSVPGVIYVDVNVQGGVMDGSSWANAFDNLYDALEIAEDGDEVWVAQGNYYLRGLEEGEDEYYVEGGVKVRGGFSGLETDIDQRPIPYQNSVLVGSDSQGNTSSLLRGMIKLEYLSGSGPTVFENFDIKDYVGERVIEVANSASTIAQCSITDCDALYQIITFNAFTAGSIVDNCLIARNSTEFNAFMYLQTDITITHCTIVDNVFRSDFNTDFESTASMFNSIWYNNVNSIGVVDEGVFVRRSLISRIYEWDAILVQYADEDPFVDRANFNYELLETSRAIALGDVVYTENDLDLTGSDRIQSTRPDAGCLESPFVRTGCSDEDAFNYDPYFEVIDNDSCSYSPLCPGDFNGDFLVNASDLLVLLSFFGDSCNIPFCGADMDGNSVTNANDLLLFLATFGDDCGGS